MVLSRRARILLYSAAGVFLLLAAVVTFLIVRFQPIARQYVISALRERYKSDAELGNLQISLFPTVKATGENLVLRFAGRRDLPPMIRITRFTVEARFIGFFRNPKRIRLLRLEGLQIHLPPRSTGGSHLSGNPKFPFVLEDVVADNMRLETMPKNPDKDPLVFDLHQLRLHSVGIGQAMTFQAKLTNPKPPGLIDTQGTFGPWNADEPTDSPVAGRYTFRNADLSVFKGIGGILSSDGQYKGHLDTIEVTGTTDTPDFSLKVADHPMPLHTEFKATVDGTDGDTILHPVKARLGQSEFEVSGAIDRGALEKHKTILLEAKTTTHAYIQDFLKLAVKSSKPPMTGGAGFDTRVKIPPGESDVVDRIELDGNFSLQGVKFTSEDVQQKIANLSHHAQGEPKNTDPNVAADFTGRFHLRRGSLSLPDLRFRVPGARVALAGKYALRSGELDFRGTAKVDATISEMTTGVKHVLLKAVDPWFKRDGAGAVLPINITGTRGDPSFKLDIGRVIKRD